MVEWADISTVGQSNCMVQVLLSRGEEKEKKKREQRTKKKREKENIEPD